MVSLSAIISQKIFQWDGGEHTFRSCDISLENTTMHSQSCPIDVLQGGGLVFQGGPIFGHRTFCQNSKNIFSVSYGGDFSARHVKKYDVIITSIAITGLCMQHKKKVQNKCRLIVLQLNLIILVLKNVQNFIKTLVGTLMCACTTSPQK